MTQIRLTKLKLTNFKGVKNFEVEFDPTETTIAGANGTGKTTLFDAYLWLLFDKDSTGRSDFEIKTLDAKGKSKKDLEHTVEGTFIINKDGETVDVTIRKTLRESWVRKRGSKIDEFTGNETTYFWNDVPIKKSEFASKIRDGIVDENIFRLLSDVRHFNSLHWEKRRTLLFSLVSEIEVDPEFKNKHLKGKTPDELRRELGASKRKLLTEIDSQPARIDELSRRIVEDTIEPSGVLDDLIAERDKLSTVGIAVNDNSDLKKRINQVRNDANAYEMDIRGRYSKKLNETKHQLAVLESEHHTLVYNLNSTVDSIEHGKLQRLPEIDNQIVALREKYATVYSAQYDGSGTCYSCGQPLPAHMLNEAKEKFNEQKADDLESIKNLGLKLNEKRQQIEEQITGSESRLPVLQSKVDESTKRIEEIKDEVSKLQKINIDEFIANDAKLNQMKSNIQTMMDELQTTSDATDGNGVATRLAELNAMIEGHHTARYNMEQNESIRERISEIEQHRMQLLEKLSDVENLENQLSEYSKKRIDSIEMSLQNMFNGIEFKMFEEQINGGTTDTCIVMKNGVPYSDLNTASKIQVSIDIINGLSRHYDTYLPIFIDNRESVTTIPPTHQLVSLIVNPKLKKLQIV